MSNDTSQDEGRKGHTSTQSDNSANDDVPEIRFAFFGSPAALTVERAQVENDTDQGDEYHEDGHKRDIVANGYIASMHRPITAVSVSFGLFDAGVEDAAIDVLPPVIRYDGRAHADEDSHGYRQRVH